MDESKQALQSEEEVKIAELDARGVHYKELNERIKSLIYSGYDEIILNGVNGQRYIGDGLVHNVRIVINGVPGNDLGAFMDGPIITVNDNAQDGVGNTMNSGMIVVKGHAGDVLGYGMRGGKIFIRDDVGYRTGIHMKSYRDQVPVIVVGGRAGDFLGEYMAGGVIVVLGVGTNSREIVGHYTGTGMHGGVIYLAESIDQSKLGNEVRIYPADENDAERLGALISEFSSFTGLDVSGIELGSFIKLIPASHRPYGNMYVY